MRIQGDEETGYDLSGDLTYDTVPDLFKQIPVKVSHSTSLNLSNVERVDSAGLALLMEWTCLAKASNKEIVLIQVPVSLKSLIDVSGFREVLSVSD